MQLTDFKKLTLSNTPGVYLFKGAHGKILYIGKATSLKDRVRSYFSPDLLVTRGEHMVNMVQEARTVDVQETDSVLEALILEAELIRTKKPLYNTQGKDDKTFNHVVITKEAFPRVLLVRGRELAHIEAGETVKGIAKRDVAKLFGPFPQGGSLKVALKIIRRIFPYRDTCTPFVSEKPAARQRPCFNALLGLCPGVCNGAITRADYARTIRHIRLFFSGKKQAVITELERDMKRFAKAEQFEEAEKTKRTIFALQHIRDVALMRREHEAPRAGDYRIEAYDVAHHAGKETVGVMTVMTDGEPDKASYRKFRIRANTRGSDTDALRELLTRRFAHEEWPLPQLIVIDGAEAQVRVAQEVINERGITVPLVSVVKNDKHKPERFIGDDALIRMHKTDILLANSEAHRFAVTYHRARAKKAFVVRKAKHI